METCDPLRSPHVGFEAVSHQSEASPRHSIAFSMEWGLDGLDSR